MFIIKPYIFNRFTEIIFGFSTKIGDKHPSLFGFNLSFSVGDDSIIVEENRKDFFKVLGLTSQSIASQKQIHSDIIKIIDSAGNNGESDALITSKKNLGIAITVADCTPIFIYDHQKKIIAGVHSGWRGTEKKILLKTLIKLKQEFHCNPDDLFIYIGPSISAQNYEVGREVADKFDSSYVIKKNNKLFLDVAKANYDMLLGFNIPENQIQKSVLCTYEFGSILHSYRRDGINSGRSLGVIAIKG